MRPTRNRYFCIAAKRIKMLFESESQAENFIKFNREEMEEFGGKAPVRSYYCSLCGGWHVTSNPNVEYFESHRSYAERKVDEIMEEKTLKASSYVDSAYKKGEAFTENGQHEDAVRASLDGFHKYRRDISRKDTANELLRLAFDSECRLTNHIIESGQRNDPIACKPAKRLLRLLKRAAEKSDADFTDEYINTLNILVGSFPNETPEKPAVELTEEELAREEEAKKIRQAEKAEKRLEKRFKEYKRRTSTIYANILANQKVESSHLIAKCSSEVKEFMEYPQHRHEIIESIDKLIEYRKLYDEKWPQTVSE